MNLVELDGERPLRIGDAELEFDGAAPSALENGGGSLTVGFRPEALQIGDGPLRARIRTVEDLGSEMFVHVAVEHRGDSVPLIAKMSPPFDGSPDDTVGLQIVGTTHVFGEDGSRIASPVASLRAPGAVSRS
jgi:ABC-type sugar transport system ATPase subunit